MKLRIEFATIAAGTARRAFHCRRRMPWAAALAWTLLSGTAWGGPGNLLWEDRLDTSPFEQAFSVATLNDRVFVAGFVGVFRDGVYRGRDFVIRSYDERTGALVWQDQVDKGSDEFASGVTTDQRRVFVSGTAFIPGRGYDWIVRAYDAATGTLLWENVSDLAGRNDFSRGTAIAAGHGLLFLGGYGTNAQGNLDWLVRAYDARSGAVVWQDQRDVGGGSDGVRSLVVKAGRLYVGGWGDTADSENVVVRAYDARTGALRWEQRTAGAFTGLTFAWRVVVDEGRVYVGAARDPGDPASFHLYLVQAYDAATGTLLWQDQIDKGGDVDYLYDLDAHEGRVFAVGVGGAGCVFEPSPPSNCDSLVRAYDGGTGTLKWEHELDSSGLDDEASVVTARMGTVFVFSQQGPLQGVPGCCTVGRWLVQAFDGATGQFLWENAGGEMESAVYNMVVHRGRLFIPGRAIDPATGNWDFIVRAYDTRGAGVDERD